MSSQEEVKLSDLQAQPPANSQTIQWLWQSDPDPWKEKDPTKWTWTPYSYEHSYLIDFACTQNQDVVDLGNYEIDLKNMLQVNKTDRNRLRRVRREADICLQSRFMLEIPIPIPIEKIQQTINPAFGNVEHFLDFIMKRTHETYALFQRLKDLDLDCKQSQFQDVIQAVIQSIQKAAESNEKVTKSRGLPNWKSPIQEAKEIVTRIETKSNNPYLTLREFLKLVLRVYTIESFVYSWLNELLRSENWAEINAFTPYLVCLAYTFKVRDYIVPRQEPQGLIARLSSVFSTQKLLLYRGTALIKEHLKFYHPGNTRLFSWNGVTSTSRNKEQALKFVRLSLKKARPGEMEGVLFTIETDLDSIRDREGLIDISKYSEFPIEEEVILAPGSVFEVIDIYKDQASNMHEVRLTLRKKFNKTHKILGNFQSRIICNYKAVLSGLDSEDIIKALNLLEGNQLVEGLRVENCVLNHHLIELIAIMRRTTNIKDENIEILNNQITVDSIMILCHSFSSKNLGQIFDQNGIILPNKTQKRNTKLKNYRINEICLDTRALKALSDKNLFEQFYIEILNESQVTRVNADLPPVKSHLIALLTWIKTFDKLQHLSLNLANNMLNEVKETFKLFKSLTNLKLDFLKSPQVSDEGLNNLNEALKELTSLTHLHLDFSYCEQISFQGKLSDTFKSLTRLTHLYLDFGGCKRISDEKLNKLKAALNSLSLLNHLHLDFRYCGKISDEGLNKLKAALMSFTSLTHLYLNLEFCRQITDEGIDKLKESFNLLTSLTHLHLNFSHCQKISDQGIEKLKAAFMSLTSLTHLYLDFRFCEQISGQAIDRLRNTMKSIPSLSIH